MRAYKIILLLIMLSLGCSAAQAAAWDIAVVNADTPFAQRVLSLGSIKGKATLFYTCDRAENEEYLGVRFDNVASLPPLSYMDISIGDEFSRIFAIFAPQNIFNADKVLLFYKGTPDAQLQAGDIERNMAFKFGDNIAEFRLPENTAAKFRESVIFNKCALSESEESAINSEPSADSRNALIDRTRSQGDGAKRSRGEASFGASKNSGSGDNIQGSVNNIVGSCIARNWDIGVIQGSAAYDLRVQMRFRPNRDGSLSGEPDLRPAGGDPKDREVIAVQVRTALRKCAPFKLPADKYSQWRDVMINMRAFPN